MSVVQGRLVCSNKRKVFRSCLSNRIENSAYLDTAAVASVAWCFGMSECAKMRTSRICYELDGYSGFNDVHQFHTVMLLTRPDIGAVHQ
jgi:hypothetical protein